MQLPIKTYCFQPVSEYIILGNNNECKLCKHYYNKLRVANTNDDC